VVLLVRSRTAAASGGQLPDDDHVTAGGAPDARSLVDDEQAPTCPRDDDRCEAYASVPARPSETPARDDTRARRPGACRRPQPRAKASAHRRPRVERLLIVLSVAERTPPPPGRRSGHARPARGRRAADAAPPRNRLLDIGARGRCHGRPQPPASAPTRSARRPDRLADYMGYCPHRRKGHVSGGTRDGRTTPSGIARRSRPTWCTFRLAFLHGLLPESPGGPIDRASCAPPAGCGVASPCGPRPPRRGRGSALQAGVRERLRGPGDKLVDDGRCGPDILDDTCALPRVEGQGLHIAGGPAHGSLGAVAV
jgi:hypothetical protein